MVTRQERIDDFVHEGTPPIDRSLEVLCEDHNGTYVLPFLCQWHGGIWQNAKTNRRIEAAVVGWRTPTRGLSEFLCEAGYPSCVHEALVEHDGELRLRLGPLARRPFPFRSGMVQDQI